jgi:hypothetical protein
VLGGRGRVANRLGANAGGNNLISHCSISLSRHQSAMTK